MAINKVIVNRETKLDLTADTATADKVLKGFTFHDATGELKTGTNEGGIDGYYVKKAFSSNDFASFYDNMHVDVTTEGNYIFFYIYNNGSIEMAQWYNDSTCSENKTVYAISTKPITDISAYVNSSSSSTSSY